MSSHVKRKPLTPTQERVLAFLRRHLAERQRLPTYQAIMAHMGWASRNGAVCHMRALAAKGWIALGPKLRYRLQGVRVEVADEPPAGDEAACAVCGCTESRACPGGCAWADDPEGLMRDVCSRCAGKIKTQLRKKARAAP